MSCNLNSLHGVILGTTMGVVQGDARSLDDRESPGNNVGHEMETGLIV